MKYTDQLPFLDFMNDRKVRMLAFLSFILFNLAATTYGQFHTALEDGLFSETVYEVAQGACEDSLMWAGVRKNVNGNPLLDQIIYGKMSLEGKKAPEVKVFPPDNWNLFRPYHNVEMIPLTDAFGKCTGYMLAFSHTVNGVDYNLHIMRLDENGNKICEVEPFSVPSHSEFINEMILDKDGTVVLVGFREALFTTKRVLLMRMDQNCKIINTKVHALAHDQDNYLAEGRYIAHYNAPKSHPEKYIISGDVGLYSMISFVDYDLNLINPHTFDLYSDGINKESATSVFQEGDHVYVTGYGNDMLITTEFTYFGKFKYNSQDVPNFDLINKYYIDKDYNEPMDMTKSGDGKAAIIGGWYENDSSGLINKSAFALELDLTGHLKNLYDHSGSELYGRILDVDNVYSKKDYWLGGHIWDYTDDQSHIVVKVDNDIKSVDHCYFDLPYEVIKIEASFKKLYSDEIAFSEDLGDTKFPIVQDIINQSFCSDPDDMSYDCDSANIAAIIDVNNVGLNYQFTSVSNADLGVISATNWTVLDESGTSISASSANAFSYIFPGKVEWRVCLAIEVTLPDATICYDTAYYDLCTDSVAMRTFSIGHDIIREEWIPSEIGGTITLSDVSSGDLGIAGLQNDNQKYATIGEYYDSLTYSISIYFSRYDKQGEIIRTPLEEIINGANLTDFKVIDFKEKFESVGGIDNNGPRAHTGYWALINYREQTTARMALVCLSRNGTILEVIQVCTEQGVSYRGADMVMFGDELVAITGEVSDLNSDLPFFLLFNHVSNSIVCHKRIYISGGIPKATTVEYLGNNEFGLAGLLGHDAFFTKVKTDCTPYEIAKSKNVDGRAFSMDVPARIVQKGRTNYIVGYTCDMEEHKVYIWNPSSQNSFLYQLDDKGSKVYDASLGTDGSFIIAGATNLNDNGSWSLPNFSKGFLISVDTSQVFWAQSYSSNDFPISHLNQIDVEEDGGIFGIGWQMALADDTREEDIIHKADTWIVKTDTQGKLYDCDCYEEIPVEIQYIEPFGQDPITDGSELECDPKALSYENIELMNVETICDRFCPEDCCEDPCIDSLIIAMPSLNPGKYIVDQVLMITGTSSAIGDSLTLQSGGTIELMAGFEVSTGSILQAINEDCEECCEMAEPHVDLPWMAAISGIENADIIRIFFPDGTCMYEIEPCTSDIKHYYDCDGHLICESGPGSANDCPAWTFDSGIQALQLCP